MGGRFSERDEDCNGAVDTPEMRAELPEGFYWDCCNERLSEPGCKIGPIERDTQL